jgi:hypothetical protein
VEQGQAEARFRVCGAGGQAHRGKNKEEDKDYQALMSFKKREKLRNIMGRGKLKGTLN